MFALRLTVKAFPVEFRKVWCARTRVQQFPPRREFYGWLFFFQHLDCYYSRFPLAPAMTGPSNPRSVAFSLDTTSAMCSSCSSKTSGHSQTGSLNTDGEMRGVAGLCLHDMLLVYARYVHFGRPASRSRGFIAALFPVWPVSCTTHRCLVAGRSIDYFA